MANVPSSPPMPAAESPAGILVVGMHRSGTSVATRLVNLLGPALAIGTDIKASTPWNPKGDWESRSLMRVNVELLGKTGHTWWYPPPDGDQYQPTTAGIEQYAPAARASFERVHPIHPWVWKDPRTSLLIPFWRRALGPVAILVVYRHPLDVASSLARRNNFSSSFALALWVRYNRLVLHHCAGAPTAVVRYDDLVDDGPGAIEKLQRFLARWDMASQAPDLSVVDDFVTGGLRHSRTDTTPAVEGDLPPDVGRLFAALEDAQGVADSFASPVSQTEPSWIASELETMGPNRRPVFNDP